MAQASSVQAESIKVSRSGPAYVVDADFHSPAGADLTFEVFTDYDHMASYVPNLGVSEIMEKSGTLWKVHQKGTLKLSLFSLDMESVREIRLAPPFAIDSRGLTGDFKRLESHTTFEVESGGVRVHYHAESEPRFPLPPLVGPALIRRQVAEQFTAMLNEIQKRQ